MRRVIEQLTGVGDIFRRDGSQLARLRYRVRVVHPEDSPQGRIGYVALALDLSCDDAPLLDSVGRLTLRCEDLREVDFFLLPTFAAERSQVLTLGSIRQPHPNPAVSRTPDAKVEGLLAGG